MMHLALRAASLPGAALFFSHWSRAARQHQHAAGVEPPPEPKVRPYQPKFFGREDFEALEAFTDILIPADGAPGARDARCAQYIDFVLEASGETPQVQAAWRKAMAALKEAGFYAADTPRRLELVGAMARPEAESSAHHPAFAAYRLIKQQTAFAFYTSREGTIETLDYKGNSYNAEFPACTHPEHRSV